MSGLRRVVGSPGRLALALLGCQVAAAMALAAVGAADRREIREGPAVEVTVAADLHLTDLTLWSGASYCRHLSRADLFAAHSVHPAAPDSLPAGSIVTPPRAVGDGHGAPVGAIAR